MPPRPRDVGHHQVAGHRAGQVQGKGVEDAEEEEGEEGVVGVARRHVGPDLRVGEAEAQQEADDDDGDEDDGHDAIAHGDSREIDGRDFDDGVSSERGMRRRDSFYSICLFRFLLFRQTESNTSSFVGVQFDPPERFLF